eukprot:g10127.t1
MGVGNVSGAGGETSCGVEVRAWPAQLTFPTPAAPQDGLTILSALPCQPQLLGRVVLQLGRLGTGWHQLTLRHRHQPPTTAPGYPAFVATSSFLFHSLQYYNTSRCEAANTTYTGNGRPPATLAADSELPVETVSWSVLRHGLVRDGPHNQSQTVFYDGPVGGEVGPNALPRVAELLPLARAGDAGVLQTGVAHAALWLSVALPPLAGLASADRNGKSLLPVSARLHLHVAQADLGALLAVSLLLYGLRPAQSAAWTALAAVREHNLTWAALPWSALVSSTPPATASLQNAPAWVVFELSSMQLASLCPAPTDWAELPLCHLVVTSQQLLPAAPLAGAATDQPSQPEVLSFSSRSSIFAPYMSLQLTCQPSPFAPQSPPLLDEGAFVPRGQAAGIATASAAATGAAVAMFGAAYIRRKQQQFCLRRG